MLDSAYQQMNQSMLGRIRNARFQLESLASRPVITQPLERIRQSAIELDTLESSMNRAVRQGISRYDQELKEMAARINSVNPLAVLARGYSLTSSAEGRLLVDCESVRPGDKISTRLASGSIISTVEQTNPEKK